MTTEQDTNAALAFVFRQAADLIEQGDLARACWRAADASGILRALLDADGAVDRPLIGLDEPTGRGFELPRRSGRTPVHVSELARSIRADLHKPRTVGILKGGD